MCIFISCGFFVVVFVVLLLGFFFLILISVIFKFFYKVTSRVGLYKSSALFLLPKL